MVGLNPSRDVVGEIGVDDMEISKSTWITKSDRGSNKRLQVITLLMITEGKSSCLTAVLAVSFDTDIASPTRLILLVSTTLNNSQGHLHYVASYKYGQTKLRHTKEQKELHVSRCHLPPSDTVTGLHRPDSISNISDETDSFMA